MLKARSLACRRGRRVVFRDLGLSLDAGGLLLVTGPNGSGKSSLLRILAGLLEPAAGEMFWHGEKIADFAPHRARLHYLGHLDALKPELTTAEMLDHWSVLRGSPEKKSPDIPEPFGLAALSATPVRHLSAGQKRRLALARLLLDEAPLWLLDEPATSLDDSGKLLLAGLIERHRGRGGGVVVASHQPAEFPDARNLALEGGGP